ncbi:MAG: hypothetical protein ACXW4H_00525 [Candidatus Limnocylindrales bacterium]
MSVEFEPVKLGPRRHRVDPLAVGVLVLVVGLVVAIAKPWATSDGDLAQVVPTQVPTGPSAGPTAGALDAEVTLAVHPHDVWGIGAIVAEPSPGPAPGAIPQLAELWAPVPDDRLDPVIDIQPNDGTVVAIGVTFPASQVPLAVRISRVHPNGREPVDMRAIDPRATGGGFLYQVVGPDGSIANWGAGRYRLEVVVDGGISHAEFTLPNRFGIVPPEP